MSGDRVEPEIPTEAQTDADDPTFARRARHALKPLITRDQV